MSRARRGKPGRRASCRFVNAVGGTAPRGARIPRGAVWPTAAGRAGAQFAATGLAIQPTADGLVERARLDFRRYVAHTVGMGVSAAIAGFRLDRGSVLGDSDEYLVARLRAGDDAAFEAIYDRYASGLLAFCVHLLGSREAAEDALQLTFVSAFRALRRGESNIALRPWLYTIARNRCLSELRTRCDVVDVDGVVVDRPFLEGVADQVERREDLREMLQDMQRLPADQRAALVLFELGDHSHEEIAAVLGVRKEKVKALVFQAREALMRGRRARERPCAEIRERLATLQGTVLARSMARAHIDRCPSCAAFESEVRRQHAALALLLPVALTSQLKASVLGSALRSGYALAATGGTAAGGAGGAGALAAGGVTAAGGAGALAAGGVTAAGGAGAAAAGSVAAATGAASTAVIAGAPSVAAVATGLTAVGADYAASVGVRGLGATGVLAKILTAAAIATAGAGAIHDSAHGGHPLPSPPAVLLAPARPSNPATALTIALTPATPLSSGPTAGAPTNTTTTAPATAPGTTATTTATAPAAAPSTGLTDTAAASVPAATTTTTSAAAPSTGLTDTAAASVPAATTTTTSAAAPSTGLTDTAAASVPAATTTTTSAAAPSTGLTDTAAASVPAATTTTTPAAASSTGTTGTSAPSAPATTTTTTPVAAPSTTTTTTSPPTSSTDSTGTVAPSAPATTTTTSPSAAPNTDSTDIAPSVAQ